MSHCPWTVALEDLGQQIKYIRQLYAGITSTSPVSQIYDNLRT